MNAFTKGLINCLYTLQPNYIITDEQIMIKALIWQSANGAIHKETMQTPGIDIDPEDTYLQDVNFLPIVWNAQYRDFDWIPVIVEVEPERMLLGYVYRMILEEPIEDWDLISLKHEVAEELLRFPRYGFR
jgi:hypothetical protein